MARLISEKEVDQDLVGQVQQVSQHETVSQSQWSNWKWELETVDSLVLPLCNEIFEKPVDEILY